MESDLDQSNAIESDEPEDLEEEMEGKLLTLKEDVQNVSRDGTHIELPLVNNPLTLCMFLCYHVKYIFLVNMERDGQSFPQTKRVSMKEIVL